MEDAIARGEVQTGRKLACKGRGCAFCCYDVSAMSPMEAAIAVDYAARLPEADQAIIERVAPDSPPLARCLLHMAAVATRRRFRAGRRGAGPGADPDQLRGHRTGRKNRRAQPENRRDRALPDGRLD